MNHRLADVLGSYSAQLSQNCDLCYVRAYECLKPPESQYGIYVSTVYLKIYLTFLHSRPGVPCSVGNGALRFTTIKSLTTHLDVD